MNEIAEGFSLFLFSRCRAEFIAPNEDAEIYDNAYRCPTAHIKWRECESKE